MARVWNRNPEKAEDGIFSGFFIAKIHTKFEKSSLVVFSVSLYIYYILLCKPGGILQKLNKYKGEMRERHWELNSVPQELKRYW